MFMMADEKMMVGSVKVDLKSFNGRANFILWQWKMKNILIQQDLHMCILGIEYKPQSLMAKAWKSQGDELGVVASFR